MERAPRKAESTGETRTTAERGAAICKHEGLTYSQFLEAAKAAIPDFNPSNLHYGKYSHEQMDAIEQSVTQKREALAARPASAPRAPENRPAPAPAPAPRAPETRPAPAAPERTPARSTASDGKRGHAAVRTSAAFLAGATLVGAGIGAAHMIERSNAAARQPEGNQIEQEQADELAEANEAGESFDISDNYRGRYADETGNYTNPNKIGRNGQEAPYNFGEAYTYTDADSFKEEIGQIAMHEPAIFSSWYYDLDDSVKVPGTENMSMSELQHTMMEDEDMHRQMVEKFLSIASSASYKEDTITGQYTNVFARTSGGGGTEITSANTEAVHCTTQENGSKVVEMTYQIGKDKTATILFREACGLQNVRLVGTPESEKIITSTPEIPTPEPEKPTTPDEPGGGDPENPEPENPEPENPTPEPENPTPAPKTPLDEREVFRDDDAGDTWEADPGAITPDTQTPEPVAPAPEEWHEDTGNYSEPEPVSEDAQQASQETGSQKNPEVEQQQQEAAQQQQKANESGNQANQQAEEREVRSEDEMREELAPYANEDGTINPDDIPY